jgi:cobalt-zinc-cadmium efflux system protein
LGSIITTFILLGGSILVIYNAILRLFNPVLINYNGMIIFAILGVIINYLAVYFTKDGRSLNQKSINLHMLEDVLGWVVVLFGAIVMKFTDIKIMDSVLSIMVALFIFINALKTLKDIVDIFLEKIPANIDIDEVIKHLLKIDGVIDVHHIHIRSIDGFNNYATMHIVTDCNYKEIKRKIKDELYEFGISHTTIEFEDKDEECDSKKCKIIKIKNGYSCHHQH